MKTAINGWSASFMKPFVIKIVAMINDSAKKDIAMHNDGR